MKKILLVTVFIILASSLNAQSESHHNNLVLAQGNYLRNLGTFGQVWSQAAGGYLGYGWLFPDHYLLMFRTGYMSHKLRSDEQINGSLSVIPIQLGGRYYFIQNTFMPYFQFMNGFNLIIENVSASGSKMDRTLVRYFWQVGLGGSLHLAGDLFLDLGINYNSAFYDNNKELYHEAGAMMNGFEYSVGVGWVIK